MTLENILQAAKASETPDAILLVADSPIAQKLVVAWKTVEIQQPNARQDFGSIKDIWTATRFDRRQWYVNAGLSPRESPSVGTSLIANGIVYPDGTVNELVRKFLNSQVADRLCRQKPGRKER